MLEHVEFQLWKVKWRLLLRECHKIRVRTLQEKSIERPTLPRDGSSLVIFGSKNKGTFHRFIRLEARFKLLILPKVQHKTELHHSFIRRKEKAHNRKWWRRHSFSHRREKVQKQHSFGNEEQQDFHWWFRVEKRHVCQNWAGSDCKGRHSEVLLVQEQSD